MLAALITRVQRVAKAKIKQAFSTPTGSTLQQFNESAGGQVIFHLHFQHPAAIRGRRAPTAGNDGGSGKSWGKPSGGGRSGAGAKSGEKKSS